MILTLFLFPHPAFVVWQKGRSIYSDIRVGEEARGELLLPDLWRKAFYDEALNKGELTHITTFEGPGPFTALRTARAFVLGVALSLPGVHVLMPSFFQVFEPEDEARLVIHTGVDQWINQRGEIVQRERSLALNRQEYGLEETRDLTHRLQNYCAQQSNAEEGLYGPS